jgi:hypothetical protein
MTDSEKAAKVIEALKAAEREPRKRRCRFSMG